MSEETVNNEKTVNAESATEDTTVDSSSKSVADTNTRPEWLPEKFTTPEDMAKSYGELESWKGKKEADIKASIQEELQKEVFADRPASAGEYQIPESLDEAEAATNPLLKEWADFAWENGYSQDEFAHWVNKFAGFMQEQDTDLEAVKTALGDNANARVEAVQLFMNKFFPEEMHNAVAELGTSAEGIKALEHIQKAMSGTNPMQDISTPSKLTKEDIVAKMRDPRYYDPARRDKAYVQEVNDGFKKLYG